MVFIWSSGGGRRRRRGHYGAGYGGPGYSGYGPPRGYGYRGFYGGGGGCLRDLLFINAGCCLANALGCGVESVLLAPTTVRAVRSAETGERTRAADRMIAAIRVYQRQVSPSRPACCRFSPSCSAYAVEAIHRHGAGRGAWLTMRRLVRCRPGAWGGADPVPA